MSHFEGVDPTHAGCGCVFEYGCPLLSPGFLNGIASLRQDTELVVVFLV